MIVDRFGKRENIGALVFLSTVDNGTHPYVNAAERVPSSFRSPRIAVQ